MRQKQMITRAAVESIFREEEKKRHKSLRYFFLNDKLHRRLHVNRGEDTLIAWCYPDHKQIGYSYSDVLRNSEKAFTTAEVSRILLRCRDTLEDAIVIGDLKSPQYTYGLTETQRKHMYMWSEKDILDLHAVLMTRHRGRPRKDGGITPALTPSVREVRGIVRQDEVLYVKKGDQFVPTFRAEKF